VGSKCGKCVERNQQVVCGNLNVLLEPEDRLPASQMA
jgi:bacterioferritin-associated ferredoxin